MRLVIILLINALICFSGCDFNLPAPATEFSAGHLEDKGNFYCDIDQDHPMIIRTDSLENQGNPQKLLAFRDSAGLEGIYRAYATYRLGAMYSGTDADSSRQLYAAALDAFSQADTIVVERIGRICNNLASAYDGLEGFNNFELQRKYAMWGIRLMLSYGSCEYESDLLPELHQFAGNALLGLKDIGEALRYYRLGIRHFSTGTEYYVKAKLYDSYANGLIMAGQTQLAASYLDSAIYYQENSNSDYYEDLLDLASFYDTYHRLSHLKGDELSALDRNAKALDIRRANTEDRATLALSYNNLGRLYYLNDQPEQGEDYLKQALILCAEAGNWLSRGTSFESLALGKMHTGDTLSALGYLDSAAIAYHGVPEKPWVTAALNPAEMRDPLMTKARLLTHLHASRPDKFPLSELELAFAQVDSLSDLLRFSVRTEASKRLVIRRLRALYEVAISTSLERYESSREPEQLDFALRYLEKGKAEILRERRALSLKKADMSESDVDSETVIMANNSEEEGQLRGASDNHRRSSASLFQDDGYQSSSAFGEAKVAMLKRALRLTDNYAERKKLSRKLEQAQQVARELAEVSYEQLRGYRTIDQTDDIAFQQITASLAKDHFVLDYFVGEKNIYVAIGRQDSISLHRLSVSPAELSLLVAEFREAIIAPGKSKWRGNAAWRNEQLDRLAVSSHQLYQLILGELFPDGEMADNLTVIPDGDIWKIPFNALVSRPVEDVKVVSAWPFLQDRHVFNYDFSARMWLERLQRQRQAGNRTLILAPVQEERYVLATPLGDSLSLSPLTMVDEEIEAIRQVRSTDLWYGQEVTRFRTGKDDLSQYGIVHFSGHGVAFPAVPEASFLAFHLDSGHEPELFRLPDLENRSIPIELLVLSACQTGDGEVSSTEGVISLARAGALAGANSVIASYWNVTQAYKPLLFGSFYTLLDEQTDRCVALDEAQRAIKVDSPLTRHPFYWAAFQNIGARGPVFSRVSQ
ncbi:hypothetical protein CEQ90_05680 [Lewinellaceae bacterium SD302]|nr:hypothetical protein CEQ90_05680 [Lewinellaceae bacterium SD302]